MNSLEGLCVHQSIANITEGDLELMSSGIYIIIANIAKQRFSLLISYIYSCFHVTTLEISLIPTPCRPRDFLHVPIPLSAHDMLTFILASR